MGTKKVNVSVNVAESINESVKTKGAKISNCVTSQTLAPTRKETKLDFISFMVGKEEISVSKFFKLFNEFRIEFPQRYSNYVSAHNLNLNKVYDFKWFVSNCPKDENGNFAKWVKVSEKVVKSDNDDFNRTTEKGIIYTLVAFNTSKASYEQFLPIFLSVVSEMKRIEREKAKAEREKEKAEKAKEKEKAAKEKALKAAKEIFAEIESLSNQFSLPFATAMKVYATTKKLQLSTELEKVLNKMKADNTK